MKLTITCQICGKILTKVEKDQISDDDIQMYESACSCDTVQDDGITIDGQTNIQATKTV